MTTGIYEKLRESYRSGRAQAFFLELKRKDNSKDNIKNLFSM